MQLVGLMTACEYLEKVARRLAQGLAGLKGVVIDPTRVQTNTVNFEVLIEASEVVKGLAQRGVAVLATGSYKIRAVTNLMVSESQIDQAIEAIAQEVGSRRPTASVG